MKRTLIALALAPPILAGCANDAESHSAADTSTSTQQESSSTETTTTSSAPTTSQMSPRGNYMTAVGAESAIGDVSSNEPAVIWKVTDITVDPQCTQSFSIPAVNGHLISASLEVETTDIYSADFRASFAPQNDWTIVEADGYTQTNPTSDASIYCLPQDVPQDLVPASKYKFTIVFDSKSPTGVLQYRPYMGSSDAGWEWNFPS